MASPIRIRSKYSKGTRFPLLSTMMLRKLYISTVSDKAYYVESMIVLSTRRPRRVQDASGTILSA
jgi:hypothetical protein